MSDIVERLKMRALALRSTKRPTAIAEYDAGLSDEAADTISALTAERDALLAALSESETERH